MKVKQDRERKDTVRMKSEALRKAIDEKKSCEMNSQYLSPNMSVKTKKTTARRKASETSVIQPAEWAA